MSPTVVTKIEDQETGVLFHVLAYSKLTPEAAAVVIRSFLASPDAKKLPAPKRGDIIEILSVAGDAL